MVADQRTYVGEEEMTREGEGEGVEMRRWGRK